MTATPYNYQVFDWMLESSIELPELIPFEGAICSGSLKLTFVLSDASVRYSVQEPRWFHHWYLPNGAINLSCGKINELYYLRFPGIAEFEISINEGLITGFPENAASISTVRHLLLDQVVPRFLSHQGNLILHASAVCFNDKTLLFLGDTGLGKSTLAMALQQTYGCSLLTDDCVKITISDNQVICIPNYIGARLWSDSITALGLKKDQLTINDGWKTRLNLSDKSNQCLVNPVRAIFFLGTSKPEETVDHCECTSVNGLGRFMEINKHCFPLDITDHTFTRRQFANIASIWKMEDILFLSLQFPRDYSSLPKLCDMILSVCSEPSKTESERV